MFNFVHTAHFCSILIRLYFAWAKNKIEPKDKKCNNSQNNKLPIGRANYITIYVGQTENAIFHKTKIKPI